MGLIGHPITALIVALLIGVASAFGFATNPAFGYLLLGLSVLVFLVAVGECLRRKGWRLQSPLTSAPKAVALPLVSAHPPPAAPAAIQG